MTVMGGMTAVNATSSVSKKVDLGLGLMYEYEDYRFSKLTRFAVADPWNKINRVGLSGRVSYRLTPRYAVFLSPVVQYAAEEGADPGRSILYGATAGVGYVTEGGSYVGLGAGVFSRLDQTTVFPALIISWKITDRLRLGNSYRTGPAGPAGFELAYTLDEKWKLAFGAGYRSYRFRLSDSSNAPGGVGQITAVPVYLALSRKLGEHLELSLYGGAAFAGGLRVEDRTGERIDSANYNTAPLLGVGFSSSF